MNTNIDLWIAEKKNQYGEFNIHNLDEKYFRYYFSQDKIKVKFIDTINNIVVYKTGFVEMTKESNPKFILRHEPDSIGSITYLFKDIEEMKTEIIEVFSEIFELNGFGD